MGEQVTNYKITATYQEALSAFERINAEIGEGATTIAGMTDKAAKLNKEFKQTKVGSEAFEFLGQQTKKANAELSAMVGTTARFNMVGINTARLFSDMGYFANSAQMGIMAIGNNISPLIESFQMAKTEGKSFGDVLKGAFSGYGGWLIGINILVSAITAYSIASSKAKKETEGWDLTTLIGDMNLYAESLAKVKKQLSEMTDVNLGKSIGELNKQLSELMFDQLKSMQMFSIAGTGVGGAGGALLQAIFGRPEDYSVMIAKVKESLNIANQELVGRLTNPKSLNFLREQLKKLNEDFEAGDLSLGSKIIAKEAQIKRLEELRSAPKAKKERESSEEQFKINEKFIQDYIDRADKLYQKQIEDRKKYEEELADYRVGAIEDVFRREEATARLKTDRLIALDKERLDRGSINQEQHNAYIALLEQQLQRQKSDIADKEEKKKQDDQDKAVNKVVQSYSKILNTSSKIGNLLERSFDKAGTGFVSKLNQALQIVNEIADVMQTAGLLDLLIKGGGAVLSASTAAGLAGTVVQGLFPIGGFNPRMAQAPTVINVQLGNTTVARVVAEAQQMAQELRY